MSKSLQIAQSSIAVSYVNIVSLVTKINISGILKLYKNMAQQLP